MSTVSSPGWASRQRSCTLPGFSLLPRAAPRRLLDPVVAAAARSGITPNGVTAAGLAINAVAAMFAARGMVLTAGLVMLAGSGLDMVDGALARATGRVSRFGAVFDAVLDRYSEALVLLGLVVYEADRGRNVQVTLLFAALTGSVLVSYGRARGEMLGLTLREGLFTRPERVVLTGAALIIGHWWTGAITAALWVLAVLTNVTALQRVYHVWVKLHETHPAEESERAP